MSSPLISEALQFRIAQSRVIVEAHKKAITAELQKRLAALDTGEDAFGQGEVTAMMLADLLFEEAREIAAFGRTSGRLGTVVREHRRLDIDGAHYARFGDALGQVLQDILGVRLAPAVGSAWVDAYWFIIAGLRASAASEAPSREIALIQRVTR